MKLLECRISDGFTSRVYELSNDKTLKTFEITDPHVSLADVASLIRRARSKTIGANNLVQNRKKRERTTLSDPDLIDAVLEDAEQPELHVRDICKKHKISTKTYYKIVRGEQ